MRDVFIPHQIEGKWGIRDKRDDQLLRNWRKGGKHLIWRGTQDDAESLCHLLNSGERDAPREELSDTQKIHYVNKARKKSAKPAIKSTFSKCDKCGKMVKTGHNCEEKPT